MNNENTYTPPLVYIVAIILAFCMLASPFLGTPFLTDTGPSWFGLDVSWQMTLNYADMHNWKWGKDIAYNYGPLGFLSTRLGFGISPWIFLIFDVYVCLNFYYVFKDFLKASASKLLGVGILVAATLLMNTNHGTDLSWVLLVFVYFWLYKTYTHPTTFSFIMLGLLSVIAFYVKANTGLIGISIFSINLFVLFIIDRITWRKALVIFLCMLAMVFASAWFLNVNLPGYLHGAFELIKGHNEVMYLDNGELRVEHNLAVLYNMIKFLFIAYFIYLFAKGKFVQFFYLGLSAAYIIMLKKQAFLRGDIQHLSEFICYAPIVLLTGNLLYYKNNTQKILSGAILFIFTIALFFKTEFSDKIDQLYAKRFSDKKEYFHEFSQVRNYAYKFQPEKRYIPDTILAKINTQTIDVFPWDSEYLIENQLNYHPRPVFQSYIAYTPYLQSLNYDFYVRDGPKYVLFDYETIDNRCAFNDEALLNMYIVKNYVLTDTFTSNGKLRSILERKPGAAALQVSKIGERKANISDNIHLVKNANFIKIDVGLTYRGKKQAFKMRYPALNMLFTSENGDTYTYRVSPELLKAGIMIEKLITSHQDFISLLTQHNSINKNNITAIRLQADNTLYNKEIVVEYYNVK